MSKIKNHHSLTLGTRLAGGSVAATFVAIGLAGCAVAADDAGAPAARDSRTDQTSQSLASAPRGHTDSIAPGRIAPGQEELSLAPWANEEPKLPLISLGAGGIIRPPLPRISPLQRIRQHAAQFVHPRPLDASPSSREVPYYHGLTYGIGVDSPSGTAMNMVATGSPSTVPNGGGQTMSFTWAELTSQEDLMSHLGISADASGGIGLFSASARFSFAKDVQMNSSSVFAVLDLQVMNAFSQIDAPGVSANASALISQGNMNGFQQQFGDRFVRGLLTGGAFFGTVEITSTSETDKQDIESTVSGAYAVISGKVSLSDSFQKAIQNHSVHVQVYTEGGTLPTQLPTDPVSLLNAANAWLPTVQNSGVVYTALVDGDSVLPLPNPPTYIDLQHQEDVLTACSLDRNADMQSLNDIAYIKRNPNQFQSPQGGPLQASDFTALNTLATQLAQDMTAITKAADNALNDPKNAALPVLQVVPPAVIPVNRIATQWVYVPDLSSDDIYSNVNGQLQSAGLVSSGQGVYASDTCPEGNVVNQSPAAGSHVPAGTVVTWYICRNPTQE